MTRTLSFLLLFAVSQIGLFGKVFHVYSPSSKENALWVVKAIPQGEDLKQLQNQWVTGIHPWGIIKVVEKDGHIVVINRRKVNDGIFKMIITEVPISHYIKTSHPASLQPSSVEMIC